MKLVADYTASLVADDIDCCGMEVRIKFARSAREEWKSLESAYDTSICFVFLGSAAEKSAGINCS